MEINVIIEGEFTGCPDFRWFQGIVAQVLHVQDIAGDVEIGIVITGQEKVRKLNRIYRGKDRPTDVLAFYMTGAEDFVPPPDGVKHLGEVVISFPQVALQAREQGHPIEKELKIIIIHGVLHLLGYDHEGSQQRKEMSTREQAILSESESKQESER